MTRVEPIEFRLQAEKNRQSSTEVIGTLHLGKSEYSDEKYTILVDVGDLSGRFEDFLEDPKAKWMDKAGKALTTITELYEEGIELGIARECVRQILPLASTTTMYLTANVRTWITFFSVRDHEHAQKETRLLAQEIKRQFKEALPIISKALNY